MLCLIVGAERLEYLKDSIPMSFIYTRPIIGHPKLPISIVFNTTDDYLARRLIHTLDGIGYQMLENLFKPSWRTEY